MNYPHIKQFQVRQYKVAEERISKAGIAAWFIWHCPVKITMGGFDRKFKRYQII